MRNKKCEMRNESVLRVSAVKSSSFLSGVRTRRVLFHRLNVERRRICQKIQSQLQNAARCDSKRTSPGCAIQSETLRDTFANFATVCNRHALFSPLA